MLVITVQCLDKELREEIACLYLSFLKIHVFEFISIPCRKRISFSFSFHEPLLLFWLHLSFEY